MRTHFTRTLAFAIAFAMTALPSAAAEPSVYVDLKFDPQEFVQNYEPILVDRMRSESIAITVIDERDRDSGEQIGQGTTARDRVFTIRSEQPPSEFIEDGLKRSAVGWGLDLDSSAGLKLQASVLNFEVVEDGKWLGSSYRGEIELSCRITSAAGDVIWNGRARGEANRYGRKQNTNNMNEVLSDALKQAFVALLDAEGVQSIWETSTEGRESP